MSTDGDAALARWPDEVGRLIEALDEPQMALMRLVFEACREDGNWPFFSWVQEKLDRLDLDATSVLAGYPSVKVESVRRYAAVAADPVGRLPSSNSEVFLTALGIWHLAAQDPLLHDSVLFPFYSILDFCAAKRDAFEPPKREYVLPRVTWQEIRKHLAADDRLVPPDEAMLISLLNSDQPPGLVAGAVNVPADDWSAGIDRQSRRFAGIRRIEDYLTRRVAGSAPKQVTWNQAVPSPLGLATAMDYFNYVWRIAYKESAGPFRFLSAERMARLANDVNTGEEFLAAISALADTVANLAVAGESGSHPCDRLEARLTRTLPPEALSRAVEAIELLRAAILVRHTGQHSSVSNEVLLAWRKLGIAYPPSDSNWSSAWNAIRGHLLAAIDSIRGGLSLMIELREASNSVNDNLTA